MDDKSFSENQENDYSFSTEISKLSEGIHYIKVETTDNAGNNCGNYPAVMVIGVDTKKPVGKHLLKGLNQLILMVINGLTKIKS